MDNEIHPLVRIMEMYSEEAYWAGWHTGLEYQLYELALAGGGPMGQITITRDDANLLYHLSEWYQCWFHWPIDSNELIKIPLDEWKTTYTIRNNQP